MMWRGPRPVQGTGGLQGMVRILLADDQAVVRRGLRALLEARRDFEVCVEASNGREAVELVLHHRPDIAVLDISLPILNGIDAARRIRTEAPGTEVMVFTRHGREHDFRQALEAGAGAYVLKAEADEHVIRAVDALARHETFFSDHVSETLLNKVIQQIGLGKKPHLLTTREREVVQLIAEGNSSKKTANLLSLSVKTVETHRSASMRKLDIHSTVQLVRYALREGLVQA
jgi:DNA-binding NarL/FixJ family response regulator